MENYFYRCPECGFVHLVPAYWVSFSPPEEMEFTHIDGDGKECSALLRLIKECTN